MLFGLKSQLLAPTERIQSRGVHPELAGDIPNREDVARECNRHALHLSGLQINVREPTQDGRRLAHLHREVQVDLRDLRPCRGTYVLHCEGHGKRRAVQPECRRSTNDLWAKNSATWFAYSAPSWSRSPPTGVIDSSESSNIRPKPNS